MRAGSSGQWNVVAHCRFCTSTDTLCVLSGESSPGEAITEGSKIVSVLIKEKQDILNSYIN